VHMQLLAQSPLLALPLFALFTFAAVFLGVGLRALLTSRSILDAAAGLPLTEENEVRHES
jgi:hypothetical protein